MEIRVFDRELEPLGIADEIESCIWSPTYWDEASNGDIKILAPMTGNNLALLEVGNIVVRHGDAAEYSDGSGNWRRAAEITYKGITVEDDGLEEIEVQGRFLKGWLSKRVFASQLMMTGTNQEIINAIVEANCGSGADEARRFAQFEMLGQEDLGGDSVEYSGEYGTDAGEAVYERALSGKLGWDILVCERTKRYGFWLYKGTDYTAGNTDGNTPRIFSRDFDNVNGQEFTHSTEDRKNTAYMLGEESEEGVQLSGVYTQDGAEYTGIDRDEVFVDASGISWEDEETEEEISRDEYYALMEAEADGELEECAEAYTFESEINTASNLEYKTDFNIGDRVTCVDKRWGVTIDVRITEMKTTNQKGKETLTATFGDSAPTLLKKIKRKVRRR